MKAVIHICILLKFGRLGANYGIYEKIYKATSQMYCFYLHFLLSVHSRFCVITSSAWRRYLSFSALYDNRSNFRRR